MCRTSLVALVAWMPSIAACGQAPAREVAGRALDERGAPLAGVCVRVVMGAEWTTQDVLASPDTRSGEDGDFVVSWPASRTWLRASEPLVALAAAGRATAVAEPFDARSEATRLAVGDVFLPAGIDLRGRVRTREGRPIQGSQVVALSALGRVLDCLSPWYDPQRHARYRSQAVAGADGVFVLRGVVATGASVRARAGGFVRQTRAFVGEEDPLVFELATSGEVTGLVLGADGEPCVAEVSLANEDGAVLPQIRTGPDGKFCLGIDVLGGFWVVARRPGGPATRSARLDQPVRGLELRLDEPPPLDIVVRDKSTGVPIADVEVTTLWTHGQAPPGRETSGAAQGRSSADGALRLPGRGTVHLSAEVEGFARHERTFVARTAAGPVVVELVRGATLAGVVRERGTDRPIPHAVVECVAGSPGSPESELRVDAAARAAEADADGRFRLQHLATGPLSLRARAPGFVPRRVTEVVIGSAEPGEVVLEIERGFTLSGRLRGAAVGPGWQVLTASNTQLSIPDSQHHCVTVPVQPDGTFRAVGVCGAVSVRLLLPAFDLPSGREEHDLGTVTVTSDLEKAFDIRRRFPEHGVVLGSVVVQDGVLPIGRIAVLTRPRVPHLHPSVYASQVLAADGTFAVPDCAGHAFLLELVDLATGVSLAAREVQAGERDTMHFRLRVLPVTVALRFAEGYRRSIGARLVVEVDHDAIALPSDLRSVVDNLDATRATLLPELEHDDEVTVFVPTRKVRFVLHEASVAGASPLVEETFTPRAGASNRVELLIPAPARR